MSNYFDGILNCSFPVSIQESCGPRWKETTGSGTTRRATVARNDCARRPRGCQPESTWSACCSGCSTLSDRSPYGDPVDTAPDL